MKSEENNNFSLVFPKDWLNATEEMSDEEELTYYRAILAHAYGLEMPEMDRVMKMVTSRILSEIDDLKKKSAEISEKRRLAGIKGREQMLANASKCQANADNCQANDSKCLANDFQEKAESKEKDEKKIKNNKEIEIVTSSDFGNSAHAREIETESDRVNYVGIVKYWNSLVKESPIPGIEAIKEGSARRDAVRARYFEHGKEEFANTLKRAVDSEFLKGRNVQGFIATFDWVIKSSNWQKIREGNYDARFDTTKQQQSVIGREDISTKQFKKF